VDVLQFVEMKLGSGLVLPHDEVVERGEHVRHLGSNLVKASAFAK
jgi:hypothetical protein